MGSARERGAGRTGAPSAVAPRLGSRDLVWDSFTALSIASRSSVATMIPSICRPNSVIRILGASPPIGVASPTHARLFSISAENPRALSTASALPLSLPVASISRTRRHSGLRGSLFIVNLSGPPYADLPSLPDA